MYRLRIPTDHSVRRSQGAGAHLLLVPMPVDLQPSASAFAISHTHYITSPILSPSHPVLCRCFLCFAVCNLNSLRIEIIRLHVTYLTKSIESDTLLALDVSLIRLATFPFHTYLQSSVCILLRRGNRLKFTLFFFTYI